MDRYAVVGNPVAHSQSPFIHALFAQSTGEPVEYGHLLCPLDGFEETLRGFANEGARGCNVTVPFKFDAFRLAPRHSERAELAGAANVLRFDDIGWFADNTDGAGLVRDIEVNAAVPLAGRRILLIGAGGAAAGALGPLLAAKPAELAVANRTLDKAVALVSRHRTRAASNAVALSAVSLSGTGDAFDVVINASASSLQGQEVPVPSRVLRPSALALDMMYGSPAHPFLAWAESHGAIGRDGLGMLVEQAAEAFRVWRGVRPETASVLVAVRERLRPSQ